MYTFTNTYFNATLPIHTSSIITPMRVIIYLSSLLSVLPEHLD